jgi:dihydroflavonol-4-reductase
LTILLTGVDTLFGSAVASELTLNGFDVRGIAAPGTTARAEGIPFQASSSNALDLESCLAALAGATAVFHLESERLLTHPLDEPAARAHVEGTRNLLVAMTRLGVQDMVYASSAMTFAPGSRAEPGDESAKSQSGSAPCLRAMRATEDLLQRYGDDGRLRSVTLHPTVMMDTGAAPSDTCGWLLLGASSGRLAGRAGGVNIVRATDAASAAIKALGRGRPCETFILAGENITLGDLSIEICKVMRELGAECAAAAQRQQKPRHARGRSKVLEDPLALMLAELGLYYTPALAEERLDLRVSPAADTIREAVESYVSSPGADKP